MGIDPLSAGIGIAGSAAGMIGSAIYREKARKALNIQNRENEADYNKDYYADYTQRVDVQSALGRMRDTMKENLSANRNTAAVTGGTPEASIAEQGAANEALSNTISNVAGQASSHKDSVRNRYLQQKSYLGAQKIAGYNDQATQWSNFGSNAGMLAVNSIKPASA